MNEKARTARRPQMSFVDEVLDIVHETDESVHFGKATWWAWGMREEDALEEQVPAAREAFEDRFGRAPTVVVVGKPKRTLYLGPLVPEETKATAPA